MSLFLQLCARYFLCRNLFDGRNSTFRLSVCIRIFYFNKINILYVTFFSSYPRHDFNRTCFTTNSCVKVGLKFGITNILSSFFFLSLFMLIISRPSEYENVNNLCMLKKCVVQWQPSWNSPVCALMSAYIWHRFVYVLSEL